MARQNGTGTAARLAALFALAAGAQGHLAQEPAGADLAGRTLFVDASAPCVGADGTPAAPFCALQPALDAARTGDRILVAPGTYGAIDYLGKDVLVQALAGPSVTEITNGLLSVPVVRFEQGEGRGAVLTGFTVRDGGGIVCDQSSPTIRANVVRDNAFFGNGGGIRCLNGADALIEDNEIRGNGSFPVPGWGGGVYAEGSSPTIERNRIVDNAAFGDPLGFGGGLAFYQSGAIVRNNLIAGNQAIDYGGNYGGGIFCFDSALTLSGNTIVGNAARAGSKATSTGGALTVWSSVVLIENTILWDNRAPAGAALAIDATSTVTVRYSDLDLLAVLIAAGGALDQGPGVVTVLPAFVDAARGDWHLSAASPLVDLGDPALAPGGLDGDREPRVVDGDGDDVARVDVGWDERQVSPLTAARRRGRAGTHER